MTNKITSTNDDSIRELFSAFDDVKASEELKTRTLDAIFAEMDVLEAEAEVEATVPDADATREHLPARISREE